MRRTIPDTPLSTRCSIFIASMTATHWPLRTDAPSATPTAASRPLIGATTACHAGRRFDGDCGNRILDRRSKPLALGPQRGDLGEFDAVALDKARVDVAGGDLGPLQQRLKESGVGLDARDADFRKGPPRLADQGAEIRLSHMDDHFGEKRVIVRIDDGSRSRAGVDADARP